MERNQRVEDVGDAGVIGMLMVFRRAPVKLVVLFAGTVDGITTYLLRD